MIEPLIKRSKTGFDETVKDLENLISENGFVHMLTKDIDKVIKDGFNLKEYSRYTIILACSPEFAKAALDVTKSAGLLFPCSFTVYEEDSKVFIGHISTMKMTVELGLAAYKDMRPVIEETAKAVNSIWEML
ncbi:MAG: DUF302 domain-containing protein [Acidobacteriota bacterium]